MMNLRELAAEENPQSFSNRMRSRRFQFFEQLCQGLPRPLHILDFGGTTIFWEQRGWAGRSDIQITMINIEPEPRKYENIQACVGDATNLSDYADGSVDVAFSNSVIEHLFTWESQQRMAAEVRRVAKAYWVQTPNFWFPVEPHFHMPAWHWLPESLRVAILRRRRCGWRGPCPDPEQARRLVQEIRLLTGGEMRRLFPDAHLKAEKFYGLTKSWIAYAGFDQA